MKNTLSNSPNSPSQPTLPGVRDWREPQIVSAQRLARMITEANSAGFEAVRLECWQKPFGYRVTFQRMADASESRNARPAQFGDGNHFATKTEPPAAEAGKAFREPVTDPATARKTYIRESFYETFFQK